MGGAQIVDAGNGEVDVKALSQAATTIGAQTARAIRRPCAFAGGRAAEGKANAFALSNAGKPIEAIAKLEALIERSGPTPERLGLLGGSSSRRRYRRKSLSRRRSAMSVVAVTGGFQYCATSSLAFAMRSAWERARTARMSP